MMKITEKIRVEMAGNPLYYVNVPTKQGDVKTRYVDIELWNNGEQFMIPEGAIVRVAWKKPDGTEAFNDCAATDNIVTIELTDQMRAAPGKALCELMIQHDGAILTSSSFVVTIYPGLLQTGRPENSDEYKSFINALLALDTVSETARKALENALAAQAELDRLTSGAEAAAERAESAQTAAKESQNDVAERQRTIVAAQNDIITRQNDVVEKQKDVVRIQGEVKAAQQDVAAKSSAAQQAAEQISADKAHIDRVVDNFDTISKAAINDIGNTTEEAKQLILRTAVDETAKIQTMTSRWTSDTNAQIDRLNADIITVRQEFASSVSAAQGAAAEAAQHERTAQGYRDEAQAAADSIGGAISPALLTTTAAGTGTVTMGSTADYPLQSLAITGETQQDGTPEPDNPVYPVSPGDGGVISVKVCGKNLVDKTDVKTNCYVNASGEEARDQSWCVATIPVFGEASIAITATTQGAAPRYCFYDDARLLLLATQSKVINIPQSARYAKLSIRTTELDGFMAEYGSTQTVYEPYKGQTVTIPVDHPIMRIGGVADTINPLTGDSLQTWGKIEFDGTEALQSGDTRYDGVISTDRYILSDNISGSGLVENVMCTHLPWRALTWTADIQGICLNTNQIHLRINNDILGITADDSSARTAKMQAYLKAQYDAGTPVTVWYQLTQPTTYQVTPVSDLRSYDGTTIIAAYGSISEPLPSIEATTVQNANLMIQEQQSAINSLSERIAALEGLAIGV